MGGNLDYILKVFFQISATFPLLFTILISSSSTSPLHLTFQQSIWYEAKGAAAHIISDSLYTNLNTDDDDDDNNNNNNNSTLNSVITLRIFNEQAVNKIKIYLNNKEIIVFLNVMPCSLVHWYECCFPSTKSHDITPSKRGREWLCSLQYKSKSQMNRLIVCPTHFEFLQCLEGLDASVLYKESVRTAQ